MLLPKRSGGGARAHVPEQRLVIEPIQYQAISKYAGNEVLTTELKTSEGLTFETSAFLLFEVANLRFQLSFQH